VYRHCVVTCGVSVTDAAVGNVEVRREGPTYLGEYEWKVTLDWDVDPVHLRGDLPLFDPDAQQLGGRWTGVCSCVLLCGAVSLRCL
jgi:hypothetical protein